MKAPRIAGLVMSSCLMLLPVDASAQSAVSGAIAGVVRDTTGAVLPGVTVEAASPALIEKVRTVVTNEQGLYRIVDLRPGTYTVTFSLTGFSTVKREGIELTVNFTVPVNAELKVGALEETITVSGETPVVDLQNVVQKNALSRAVLDTIPNGKGLMSYSALTLGAVLPANAQDVGGNRGEFGVSFSIHGGPTNIQLSNDGFRYSMQGNGGGAGRGLMVNHASAQEITLETTGMSAEVEHGAIQMNIVPKEGGNIFSGTFVANYTNKDLQNSNLSDTLRARGITAEAPVREIYDYSFGLGGPIKKDKLWFYTGHRWWGASQYAPGNYFNKTQDSWFYTPDLSRQAYSHDYNRAHDLRLTWQVAQKHRLNIFYGPQKNCTCFNDMLDGGVAPEASRGTRYYPVYLANVAWTYPATNRLLFEAGAAGMSFRYQSPLRRPNGATEVSPDAISVLELSNNYMYRSRAFGVNTAQGYGLFKSKQVNERLSMSYITGSHAFKTGLFMLQGWGDTVLEINRSLSYRFLNGVPAAVALYAMPNGNHFKLRNVGTYAQDQWTVRKLTLNLGVRFDYLNAWVPEQHFAAGPFVPARDFAPVENVPNWKDVSPRLGASYDLFGNGKTALKVQLGRYVAGEGGGLANAVSPATTSVNTATRTWTDANGDFIPDCDLRSSVANGECGALSPATFGQVRITTRYDDDVLKGFGKRGYTWEGSVSVQHELRPGFGLNVGYFRTWYGNFLVTDNLAVTPADFNRYCIAAPVDARLPGGGGNQACGLYDVSLAKFGQVNNLVTFAKNFGKQTQVFNGVDVGMNARFGRGGLFAGGLSTGATVTDNCFVVDSPQQQREGYCHVSPSWASQTQVKFSGSYPLPWNLQSSANFQYLPGIPQAASFVATSAQIAPSLGRNLSSGANGTATIDLIEPQTVYEDRITQLDVRVTKTFRVGRTRLQGMFDAYNVLNANTILTMTTRYGPAWLKPTQILSARLFKFGAQVDF